LSVFHLLARRLDARSEMDIRTQEIFRQFIGKAQDYLSAQQSIAAGVETLKAGAEEQESISGAVLT
jgi:hypothetical protein